MNEKIFGLIIIITLILYISIIEPIVSNLFSEILDFKIVQIIMLILVFYVARIDFQIALLISLAFLMTLETTNYKRKGRGLKLIKKWHAPTPEKIAEVKFNHDEIENDYHSKTILEKLGVAPFDTDSDSDDENENQKKIEKQNDKKVDEIKFKINYDDFDDPYFD
jgi:hypothetical protein